MSDPQQFSSFREQIQSRLNLAQSELEQEREAMDDVMAKLEQREKAFNQVADQLFSEVLCPTLETFADYFDNAQLDDAAAGRCVRCQLRHSVRFPAVAHVGFQVSHNDTIDTLSIQYEAQILPVFIRFERDDALNLNIETVEPDAVRRWTEKKLLGFIDSYLQIETHEQYQHNNIALDPVCGMRVAKPKGLAYEYDGQLYYFCAQRCLDRFAQNPEGFVLSANK